MAGRLAQQIGPWFEALRSDIYKLCEALNFVPNAHQVCMFNAIMRAKYGQASPFVAVKSGQGTGKTAGTNVVALFCALQCVGAMTVLSAPTMKQCTDVWLTEMRRIVANAHPVLRRVIDITNTQMYLFGQKGWGVTSRTATRPENFQGLHQLGMSIIFEEASGISRPIFETAKGTLTNPDKLFVAIGNPNTRDCAFFDCFHAQRKNWQCLTFNAEETPASEWFDPQRNKLLEEEYGRDSDVYRVRVLGEFPHTDPRCVISSEDVEAAFDQKLSSAAIGAVDERQIGMDFARFGGDENTVYQRRGYAIIDKWHLARVEPSVAIDRAFAMQAAMQWPNAGCKYVVDAGGIGQGAMHRFYDAGKQVMEFHFGSTAMRSQEYGNKATEGWFEFGKLLRGKKAFLGRHDPNLVVQLANRRYETNKKGQLVLESKDDYLKRFEDSPDRADGIMQAFYPHAWAKAQVHFASTEVRR